MNYSQFDTKAYTQYTHILTHSPTPRNEYINRIKAFSLENIPYKILPLTLITINSTHLYYNTHYNFT